MTLDELLRILKPEIKAAEWTFPLQCITAISGESAVRRRRVSIRMEPRQELVGLDDKGREVWVGFFRTECPRGPDGWRELTLWGAGEDPERALTILRDWMGAE